MGVTFQPGQHNRSDELVEDGGKLFVNLKCIERYGGFRTYGLKRFEGAHKPQHTVAAGDIVMAVTDMTQERMVIARAGRLPRTVDEPAIFSMDMVKIVPNEGVPAEWLYYLLRYSTFPDEVKEHATGTTVLHLKPKHIEQWQTGAPPARERRLFADAVRPLLDLQDNLLHQNRELERARDLLLPKLMSGEVTV